MRRTANGHAIMPRVASVGGFAMAGKVMPAYMRRRQVFAHLCENGDYLYRIHSIDDIDDRFDFISPLSLFLAPECRAD